jgi:hypothetical protein
MAALNHHRAEAETLMLFQPKRAQESGRAIETIIPKGHRQRGLPGSNALLSLVEGEYR